MLKDMTDRMSTLILKVDLACSHCYKKIQTTLCKLQVRWKIQTITYDEKKNTVTISGPFDPHKLSKKLCCKAYKVIKDIQIVIPDPPPPVKKPGPTQPPPVKKPGPTQPPPDKKPGPTKPPPDKKPGPTHPPPEPAVKIPDLVYLPLAIYVPVQPAYFPVQPAQVPVCCCTYHGTCRCCTCGRSNGCGPPPPVCNCGPGCTCGWSNGCGPPPPVCNCGPGCTCGRSNGCGSPPPVCNCRPGCNGGPACYKFCQLVCEEEASCRIM